MKDSSISTEHITMCFWICVHHLQRNVVGNSLSLYEVFGLVLGDYMPADSIIDAVL